MRREDFYVLLEQSAQKKSEINKQACLSYLKAKSTLLRFSMEILLLQDNPKKKLETYTWYELVVKKDFWIHIVIGVAPLLYWVHARQVIRPIAVLIQTLADLFIIYFRG